MANHAWLIFILIWAPGFWIAYFMMCNRLDKGHGISEVESFFAVVVAIPSWFTVITLAKDQHDSTRRADTYTEQQ